MNRRAHGTLMWMLLPVLSSSLLLSGTGCVVYDKDPYTTYSTYTTSTVVTNATPYVVAADAYMSFDPFYGDDLVSFEATVDDPNGVGDVLTVWADVYDDGSGGELVASIELFPTNDPYFWAADAWNSELWLDPYWDFYTVDFVVYDVFEDASAVNVPLYTH